MCHFGPNYVNFNQNGDFFATEFDGYFFGLSE